MRVIVDAMGGDHAPEEIIKGCIDSQRDLGIHIILVGREDVIERELTRNGYTGNDISIIHASQVIEVTDQPVSAIKAKKDASMVVGLNLLRKGEGDAFISAGNTGALMAGALLRVGRIKGIDRPALAPTIPTEKGSLLLLDAGANTECRPNNLVQFGIMGSIYMDKVLGVPNPRIGLVNVGTEENKGNELVKKAYTGLSKTSINFVGNIEARDIPKGIVDVVVCDGFVGNIILKFMEGVALTLFDMLKTELSSGFKSKIGALLCKKAFKSFKRRMDYTEYGGAPLLGINGPVIKAHGSSNAKAIQNAINLAHTCDKNGVLDLIKQEVVKLGVE
ncbi:MAG: phosphate acyltransferase PlsX [Mahellales bacterium]|jgi:glycerol-3-phosphate acyltransferase PlsX